MQRPPEHLYSEVIRKKLVAHRRNHLMEQETRLIGTHAKVTQFIDELNALKKHKRNTTLHFKSPYPDMALWFLVSFFCLAMLAKEETPWKILFLLAVTTGTIFNALRQPGKYAGLHRMADELKEKEKLLNEVEKNGERYYSYPKSIAHVVTVSPELQISQTLFFANWLENKTEAELVANQENIIVARAIYDIHNRAE